VKRRSVGANAVALSSGEAASRVLFATLTILVARLLGASNLGRFVFATSLAGIVQVVSDFGLTVYLVRTLAKDPSARRELLPSIAALRLMIATLGVSIAMAYAVATIHDATLVATTALAVSYILLLVYAEFVFALFRVEESMFYEAAGKLAGTLAYAGGGITLVATGMGIVAVVAWSCVVALGLDAYAWLIGRRLQGFHIRPTFDRVLLRRAFLASLPFGVLAILTSISFRIDSVMIEAIRGTTSVGLYGAAYRTMEALLILPGILAVAVLPVIARSIESDPKAVLSLINTAIRLLWSVAFPLVVGFALLGGTLLADVFGPHYRGANVVLTLLGATLLPLFASAMTSTVIAAGARPQLNTMIAGVMVVLNVTLNLVLIPAMGINGAGVATLATESAGLIAGAILIARMHGSLAWHRFAVRPLVAAGSMGALVELLGRSLAGIPLYVAVYIGVLVLLRGLTRADWALVRSALDSRSIDAASAD
jgi:O-antigen/teichoic acid export membrane protein